MKFEQASALLSLPLGVTAAIQSAPNEMGALSVWMSYKEAIDRCGKRALYRTHPDRGGCVAEFLEVQEALEVLRTSEAVVEFWEMAFNSAEEHDTVGEGDGVYDLREPAFLRRIKNGSSH